MKLLSPAHYFIIMDFIPNIVFYWQLNKILESVNQFCIFYIQKFAKNKRTFIMFEPLLSPCRL